MKPLTKRETEVILAISTGLPDKMLSEKLGMSLNTMHAHKKNIYGKLGTHSKVETILKVNSMNQDTPVIDTDSISEETMRAINSLVDEIVDRALERFAIKTEKPMTKDEARDFLKVSWNTLDRWTLDGLIPAHHIDGKVRYFRHELIGSMQDIQDLKYKRKTA